MAKYVMSEMTQASVDIASWASKNIDTLNDKVKSLEEMINDQTNSGELIDNIKQYASYDVSGINSLINGLQAIKINAENAISAYNCFVKEDVDTEILNNLIEENNQQIMLYENHACSIKSENDVFAGCIRQLKDANAILIDLKQRFEEWVATHSNDFGGANEVVKKACDILKRLGEIPFDSNGGYDLKLVDIKIFTKLDNDSGEELLIAKGYITSDGDITEDGFSFIEGICKQDYNDITSEQISLAKKLILSIDTPEEVEGLTNAGYCIESKVYVANAYPNYIGGEYNIVTKRETSMCFEILIEQTLNEDLYRVSQSEGTLDEAEWIRTSNNLTCLFAIYQFFNKVDYIYDDVTIMKKKDLIKGYETADLAKDGLYTINYYQMDYQYFGIGNAALVNKNDYERLKIAEEEISNKILNFFKYPWQVAKTLATDILLILSFMAKDSWQRKKLLALAGAAYVVSDLSKVESNIKTIKIFTGENNKTTSSVRLTRVIKIDGENDGSQYITDFALSVSMADGQIVCYASKDTPAAMSRINNKLQSLVTDGVTFNEDIKALVDGAITDAGFSVENDVIATTVGETGEINYKFKAYAIEEISIEDLYDENMKDKISNFSRLYNGLDGKGDFHVNGLYPDE